MISAETDDDVPSSIRDAVDRELMALGDAGATIRTAAAIGPEVDVDLLASVDHSPTVGVLDDLERAATAGLLVESEDGFQFRHELVRSAVEATMTSPRRALCTASSRAMTARRRSDPLAVAFHARRGGDDELAARSLVEAAEQAAGRYDVDTADNLLSDAFAPTPIRRPWWRGHASACPARSRRCEFRRGDGARGRRWRPPLEMAGWVAYYRRDY